MLLALLVGAEEHIRALKGSDSTDLLLVKGTDIRSWARQSVTNSFVLLFVLLLFSPRDGRGG